MSNTIHKGTELNNVKETWQQNEREHLSEDASSVSNENLENLIAEEASEYEKANKEQRILGGERASVNDDKNTEES